MIHRTVHWRTARRILGASAAVLVVAGTGIAAATQARADELSNCITTTGFWIFKGTARDICDGVRRPDGSWLRAREFYTPAHWVNARSSCSGGRYYSSCTYSPGYWQERTSSGVETYVVFDSNVLPDEPGHLE